MQNASKFKVLKDWEKKNQRRIALLWLYFLYPYLLDVKVFYILRCRFRKIQTWFHQLVWLWKILHSQRAFCHQVPWRLSKSIEISTLPCVGGFHWDQNRTLFWWCGVDLFSCVETLKKWFLRLPWFPRTAKSIASLFQTSIMSLPLCCCTTRLATIISPLT